MLLLLRALPRPTAFVLLAPVFIVSVNRIFTAWLRWFIFWTTLGGRGFWVFRIRLTFHLLILFNRLVFGSSNDFCSRFSCHGRWCLLCWLSTKSSLWLVSNVELKFWATIMAIFARFFTEFWRLRCSFSALGPIYATLTIFLFFNLTSQAVALLLKYFTTLALQSLLLSTLLELQGCLLLFSLPELKYYSAKALLNFSFFILDFLEIKRLTADQLNRGLTPTTIASFFIRLCWVALSFDQRWRLLDDRLVCAWVLAGHWLVDLCWALAPAILERLLGLLTTVSLQSGSLFRSICLGLKCIVRIFGYLECFHVIDKTVKARHDLISILQKLA